MSAEKGEQEAFEEFWTQGELREGIGGVGGGVYNGGSDVVPLPPAR